MTIEEILARKECQTFDCKSIQIDPKALAIPIVAMANADQHQGNRDTDKDVRRSCSLRNSRGVAWIGAPRQHSPHSFLSQSKDSPIPQGL